MTNGFRNIFGEERNWPGMVNSGVSYLVAVAVDWIFGTSAPPTAGGAWLHRAAVRRKKRRDEEDEFLALGG